MQSWSPKSLQTQSVWPSASAFFSPKDVPYLSRRKPACSILPFLKIFFHCPVQTMRAFLWRHTHSMVRRSLALALCISVFSPHWWKKLSIFEEALQKSCWNSCSTKRIRSRFSRRSGKDNKEIAMQSQAWWSQGLTPGLRELSTELDTQRSCPDEKLLRKPTKVWIRGIRFIGITFSAHLLIIHNFQYIQSVSHSLHHL